MQRNPTIDIARGIGIVLVVLGHSWLVSQSAALFSLIYSFHVPLFLFLSGLVLKTEKKFLPFVRARADSLLKPYLVVLGTLGLVQWIAAQVGGRSMDGGLSRYMGGVLYGAGRTIEWTPLWFLPHLFLVSCVALLLLALIHRKMLRWLLVMILLVSGIFLIGPRDWMWSCDLLPLTLAFVLAGHLLRDTVVRMRPRFTVLALALCGHAALWFIFHQNMDLNMRYYGNGIVVTLEVALGITWTVMLSRILSTMEPVRRLLAYIGSATLFILLFHGLFLRILFEKTLQLTGSPPLAALISIAGAIGMPIALWECSKRSRLLQAALLPGRPTPMRA